MFHRSTVLLMSAIAVLPAAHTVGVVRAQVPVQGPRGNPTEGSKKKDAVDGESTLRKSVEHFIAAADKVDAATMKSIYDPGFTCVRVADEGGMTKLTRDQMLGFMNAMSFLARGKGKPIPTKETTIHHVEIIGDDGFVILTRTKDLGHGWEPMYYSLVWKRSGGEWKLLREFVHQRTMPKFTK